MGQLTGRIALVTGAAAGIGAASARALAAEGAELVIIDLDAHGGEAFAQEIGATFIHADLSVRAQTGAAIKQVITTHGRLDVLVNNAGIAAFGTTTEVDPEDWDRVIAVDFGALFDICREAIPHMPDGSAVVNVVSIFGMAADHRNAAYSAAKGAALNYTRALALDHARQGIRVNAVCPGLVRTKMAAGLSSNQERLAAYNAAIPLGRMGEPEEIAEVVRWLASPGAAYVTGAAIAVDGGLMASAGAPRRDG